MSETTETEIPLSAAERVSLHALQDRAEQVSQRMQQLSEQLQYLGRERGEILESILERACVDPADARGFELRKEALVVTVVGGGGGEGAGEGEIVKTGAGVGSDQAGRIVQSIAECEIAASTDTPEPDAPADPEAPPEPSGS